VTGTATGDPVNQEELLSNNLTRFLVFLVYKNLFIICDTIFFAGVKTATSLPVLVGSGTNLKNVQQLAKIADAVIVGTYFKRFGR